MARRRRAGDWASSKGRRLASARPGGACAAQGFPSRPGGAVLTISEVAGYAGVTVRAVRHYHQRGLLPEPLRDSSGYRRYAAGDVVRLIRIRTLAEAGVPLARVQELLDATPRSSARRSRRSTPSSAQEDPERRSTAAGSPGSRPVTPSRPRSVVTYLDKLRQRGIGGDGRGERDGWILIARLAPGEDPRVHGRQAPGARLPPRDAPDVPRVRPGPRVVRRRPSPGGGRRRGRGPLRRSRPGPSCRRRPGRPTTTWSPGSSRSSTTR